MSVSSRVLFVGEKFGKLIISHIEQGGRKLKRRTIYTCSCECGGTYTTDDKWNLTSGHSTSCGCVSIWEKRKSKNEEKWIGQKFNKLTIVGIKYGKNSDGRGGEYEATIAICKCDCGNDYETFVHRLVGSNITCCGCVQKEMLQKVKDEEALLIGKRFGKLVIKEFVREKYIDNKAEDASRIIVVCHCDCYPEKEFRTSKHHILRGDTTSCGCFHDNRGGISASATGRTWCAMIFRCANIEGYLHVPICEYIRIGPQSLIELVGPRSEQVHKNGNCLEYTLDRFPNKKGGYTCGKCNECKQNGWEFNLRWATKSQQVLNRDKTKMVEAFGEIKPLAVWAREVGIGPNTINIRLKHGWDPEEALTTPVQKHTRKKVK